MQQNEQAHLDQAYELLVSIHTVSDYSCTAVRVLTRNVRPRNTRTKMYASRVACCPLVRHVEYAPRALLRLEKRRDRQTDGRQTSTLRLPLDVAGITSAFKFDRCTLSLTPHSRLGHVRSCACVKRQV